MNAVVQQAKDRTHSTIRDIDSYMEVRRKTIGAWPSFALLELDMDLPEDFMDHPVMHELHVLSISMICLGNVSDIAPLPSVILPVKYSAKRILCHGILSNLAGTTHTIL